MLNDSLSDSALFLQAMGQVCPVRARGRAVALEPAVPTQPMNPDLPNATPRFILAPTDDCRQSLVAGHVAGVDSVVMNRLRAGALRPQAQLDLHGLTVVQAFENLRAFMRTCWHNCLGTVMIIPGVGRNSPDGRGVLREKLQNWLIQEPCNRVVLAFCTAQPHDGGAGSMYVQLRKKRKNIRIDWARMPDDMW
ncbi:MAG: Smr/MutS family protein [Desulfovibrio sp.]|nr:Smr/MutS family protein [Desulfovibrio sp.]